MSDTESGITPTAERAVDRKEFADALRILKRSVKVARVGHCIIGFSEGNLVIRIGGAVVRARASGYWPGEVRLRGELLVGMAAPPPRERPGTDSPRGGPLLFRPNLDQVHLATPGASAIEIPIGATLPLILRIARQHPREAIEVSGIAKVVDAAFAKENRLIEKAAAMLAPLGVPEEEVRRLVIGRARG